MIAERAIVNKIKNLLIVITIRTSYLTKKKENIDIFENIAKLYIQ